MFIDFFDGGDAGGISCPSGGVRFRFCYSDLGDYLQAADKLSCDTATGVFSASPSTCAGSITQRDGFDPEKNHPL